MKKLLQIHHRADLRENFRQMGAFEVKHLYLFLSLLFLRANDKPLLGFKLDPPNSNVGVHLVPQYVSLFRDRVKGIVEATHQ